MLRLVLGALAVRRRDPPMAATDPSTVAPMDPRPMRAEIEARRAHRQVRRTVGQRDPFSIPEVGRRGKLPRRRGRRNLGRSSEAAQKPLGSAGPTDSVDGFDWKAAISSTVRLPPMTHDWLLVETLGSEPAVVAHGLRTKNLVPISAFLRRNPNLMAIQTAIGETVRAGVGLSSITPKNDRVIRTEVVQMSDGRIHGVHVWIGPPDLEPPERPVPGPLKWDLTRGVATDTPESLFNSGRDPDSRGHPGAGVRRRSADAETSTPAKPRCSRC